MKILKATITGADNTFSSVEELGRLSVEFPFVEWGILFSPSDFKPRYPTGERVLEILKLANTVKMNLSAHLCGGFAKRVMPVFPVAKKFQRIQLNTTSQAFHEMDLHYLDNVAKEHESDVKFIFQYRGENDDSKVQEIVMFNINIGDRFNLLYDISGGRGVLPGEWPKPFEGVLIGYAGGLNPDNLKSQLEKIESVVGDNEITIDMESGVRTNNEFDLTKVRTCLEIASIWA